MSSRVEEFAKHLPQSTTDSVRAASAAKVTARRLTLAELFENPDEARKQAAAIKDRVLGDLEGYLAAFEERCKANGIQVHHAVDADEANRIILQICAEAAAIDPKSEIRNPKSAIVVKGKSMASEEIHLNKHLEEAGYEVVETDLGEFVVQLDHDTPSHIVTPIIHKNRKQIAQTFEREHLGPFTEVPEELTMQARAYLRSKFREASVGISGVNFAVAATGRLVIVENEGNNRLCTTAPDVHVAIMGIEKLVPAEGDLALFLPLLAASATGQRITTYAHFISGPRRDDEADGPREVHLVLLDNGRRKVHAGKYREILRCIRCGACLNVCPVYRQASGHGYGHVYSGPMGAVLAPALEGVEKYGDLPKASSLCGACEEVCPVAIPIPRMLLDLRDDAYRAGVAKEGVPWGLYAYGASSDSRWRAALKMLPMLEALPNPMKSRWSAYREAPKRQGRSFRKWWKDKQGRDEDDERDFRQSGSVAAALQSASRPLLQTNGEAAHLWASFETQLNLLGGQIISRVELDQLLAQEPWLEPQAAALLKLSAKDSDKWNEEIGVAVADLAIAESGTLVFSAGPDKERLVTLAPPVSVVLINRQSIVSNLAEAIQRLSDRTSVFVTGPSRTADIEGVLVRGVHGPGKLLVHVYD